ncbi:MAG: hypothetical protein ABI321_24180 [Polyangia bacterium]
MGGAQSDDRARAELARLVEAHLSKAKRADLAICALAHGIALVGGVVADLQSRVGAWGDLVGRLREAESTLRAGFFLDPNVHHSVARAAQRQLDFATLLIGEVERLQASETTLV